MNLHATAQAVAAEIPGWRHAPAERVLDHIAYLRHEETGALLSIRAPNYPPSRKHKLEIKGVYPSPYGDATGSAGDWGVVPYGTPGPHIHVAATRTPHEIAFEIRRRFLPEFMPVWHTVQVKHTARLLEDDRRDRLLAALLATGDGSRYQYGRAYDYRGSIHYRNDPHRTHAEVEVYDDNVHLKLTSLPGAIALEVMQLIAERTR
jgi:hypothetical protein